MTFHRNAATILASSVCIAAMATPASAQQRMFNIPAGSLKQALDAYGRQSGKQLIYKSDEVKGARSAGASGMHSADDALAAILAGTGFVVRRDASGALAIVRGQTADADVPEEKGVADILVTGTRSQNADVVRTRDDVQPYVVIPAEEISRSGATNLEQFLQRRLPMNSQRTTTSQANTNAGLISLRGLSSAQTLILVDGRRMPSVGISTGSFGQPNINGISLSSIERIEILPATAGGIYGGGATGGVINIILKRDPGLTIDAAYGNTSRWDSDNARISVNGGFSLEGGKTRVTFGATRSTQSGLAVSDRSFQRDARALNWQNRPADFSTPIYASTPNICAVASATATTCSATTLLTLKSAYGGTALNSAYASVPASYAGVAVDGVAGLVATAGQPNFDSVPGGQSLYASQNLQSYLGSIRRKFGNSVEVYVDGGWDRTVTKDRSLNLASVTLPSTDANNPFSQNIRVSIPLPNLPITSVREIENARIGGGVIVHLPTKGTIALEKTWSEGRNASRTEGSYSSSLTGAAVTTYLRTVALSDVFASFPDTTAVLGAADRNASGPIRVTQDTTTLRFAQPFFRLPGGSLTLSGYLEQRIERALASTALFVTPTTSSYTWYAPKRRRVNSAYSELRAPIFSPGNDVFLMNELELFGSIRYDDYRSTRANGSGSYSVTSLDGPFPSYTTVTNKVSATSYTAGVKYSPIRDIAFRASYGTGFLPPDLSQITTSSTIANLSPNTDPRRGNTPLGTAVTILLGGSPDLKPEKSKSFSAGAVLTPRFLDGFRVSLDFTHISKSDELGTISIANLLLREAEFPGLIVRGANLPTDPAGWAGPITSISNASFNVAKTEVKAWDLQFDYRFGNKSIGMFRPYVIGTYQTLLMRQVLSTDAQINTVGAGDGAPLRWKGNFGVDWDKGPLAISWNAQFFDKYRICAATLAAASCAPIEQRQGSQFVPSQLYNDLIIQFDFGQRDGGLFEALSNTKLTLSVFNIFDKRPPLLATTSLTGYDFNGDPRLRRFQLGLSKAF
ncbi:TonB-dependent receptor [Sphingomonas sp. HITSZ_GF]|uniref:TonB-dependent receptor domain-containing protein n=1 Tax=Sphingomonas sp. HITSZ_GF TaxID=3037247 RepID=UPI00240E834D|nr:TonB-dependent receptor [Sphingomonas sp. HITSZ_GF]MDG2533032.1 TonB-dependent receptor [Sphingomonas sp. HITSZ_GF]